MNSIPTEGPYKRQYERFRQRLEVRWEGATGKRSSWVTEIGMGGCYIETPGHVEIGEIVVLEIRLQTGQWLYVSGEVRHAHRGIGFGVKFINVSKFAKESLKTLIDHINTQKTGLSMAERMARLSQDINFAIIKCHTLQGGLYRSAEAMVQHLDAAFAGVWTSNRAGLLLELQTSTGTYTNIEGLYTRVPVGSNRIGLIAKERQPFLSNYVSGDSDICESNWAKREEFVSFAGYPLVIDERLVGVMGIFSRHQLTDSIIEALASVSHTISQWIDRKRMEENLRWAAMQNEAILAATSDGICGLDLNGKITFINAAGAKIVGWEEKELIGASLHDTCHHSYAEGTPHLWSESPIHKVFKDGIIQRVDDGVFWRRDGSSFPVEYSSSPIKDNEKITGAIVIFRDITDRRQLEDSERFKAEQCRALEETIIKNEKDYERSYKALEEGLLSNSGRYDELVEGVRSFAVPSIKLTVDLMDNIGTEYVGAINRLLRLWSFMVNPLPESQKISITKYILINPPRELSNEPDIILRLWVDAQNEEKAVLLRTVVLDQELSDEQRKRVWIQIDRVSYELGSEFFIEVMPRIFSIKDQAQTIDTIFASEDMLTSLFLSNENIESLGALLLDSYHSALSENDKNRLVDWMMRVGADKALEQLEKSNQLKQVKA
jgi:PAS domain S-box-containing protein